jgi:glycosyltransferase involved in cell wall biosynthesis
MKCSHGFRRTVREIFLPSMEITAYTAYLPVYNQAATIGSALASLRAQSMPPAEILVVDDGSTDDSAKIAQEAGATVLRQTSNLGRGAARARAMEASRNELILGLDAGNRLPPDFASRALAHFADAPRLAAVHGWFIQSNSGNVVERWRSRHLFAQPAPSLQKCAVHVTSGYVGRRSAILAVGNYNVQWRAGEDAELGRRLQAAGWEIWLDPKLGIECLTRDSVASVFERYARWNETQAPTPDTHLWQDYAKRCAYAVKVLAARDAREGDWAAIPLSLALPNFLAWRAWRRKREAANTRPKVPTVHYVNTYIESLLDRCWRREGVSRAHLWGADALANAGFNVQPIRSLSPHPILRLARWLTHISGGRTGDLAADLLVLRHARSGDIIYVAGGQLLLTPLAIRSGILRAQLVAWIYKPSASFSWKSFRDLAATKTVRSGYAGWLALTPHVESWLRKEHPAARIRRVVWSADTEYYPPASEPGGYFAATGVTQRDYSVLLAATGQVKFPFIILGPAELQGQAPANVSWRSRKPGEPHGTIDDDELRRLYQGARAVLIPLKPDPDDASGFTNLLEAIACGRPVVMTRTGALDLTPAALGIGYDAAPGDTTGWINALQKLAGDPDLAKCFSDRAIELGRAYFNLPRFEKDLVGYFMDLVANHPEPPPENVFLKLPEKRPTASLSNS